MLNINMSIRESLGNLPSQYAESGGIKKKKYGGAWQQWMLCGLGTDHHTCVCNRISVLWINGLSFRHDLWGATPARSHTRQWRLFSERLKWSSIASFSHLNRERMYTMRSSSQKVTQHCSLVTRERKNISCKNDVLIIEELIMRLSYGQTMIWR